MKLFSKFNWTIDAKCNNSVLADSGKRFGYWLFVVTKALPEKAVEDGSKI